MAPAQKSSTPPTVLVQARIPTALAGQAKSIAATSLDGPGGTLSDFLREAVESEISRRTLCKPVRDVGLLDLGKSMDQVQSVVAAQGAQLRLIVALLESISQAVGVSIGEVK